MNNVVQLPHAPKQNAIGLTQRQRQCWEYVARYEAEHGRLPTFDEIGKAIGLVSRFGVIRTLTPLFERGLISREIMGGGNG